MQDPRNILTFAILVGINEEFWKAFVTYRLIRNSKNFNEPIDALIYAMVVSFGFSLCENIIYTNRFGLDVFFLRQFNAVPLHVGLAAYWAIGLIQIRFYDAKGFRSVIPYLFIPILLHAGYDYLGFSISGPEILVIAIVIAFSVIWYSLKKLKKYQKISPFKNMVKCEHCGKYSHISNTRCRHCMVDLPQADA